MVLHVGQPAQLRTLPAQLCHLLLQPVDPALDLAAQGDLMAAEELAKLGTCLIHVLGELCEQGCALLL